MRRISSHTLGIDQGEVILFSDFETDGEMWAGEGPRVTQVHVKFKESYDLPPAVTVALSMWDFSHQANVRADVKPENITCDGFDIVFRTWGDTKIARVRTTWQSIGGVSGDEAWDV